MTDNEKAALIPLAGLVFSVCLSLIVTYAFAQAQALPAGVCTTLKQERAKYPAPIAKSDLGKVLNTTAWVHRGIGLGLGRKTSGTRCPSPAGDIACDYLIRKSDMIGWDVIANVEGPASVSCNTNGVVVDNRPWVAPVNPGPTPPQPPSTDLTARVEALEKSVAALTATVKAQQGDISELKIDVTVFWSHLQKLSDRVLVLENTPPSGCIVQEVDTSRAWGHVHTVKTCVQ